MKKLYVIPGHGAGDNGSCANGYKEAERVRALAQKIKDFGGDNVILADFDTDAYKSNTIGKGEVPKGCLVLELHLDGFENTAARGGHIVIDANFKADKYDKALAKMISEMFPGRSDTIVGRTDIANINRARAMGYNYRLMECCFITNAADIKKFNANIDELAKKILKSFGLKVVLSKTIYKVFKIVYKQEGAFEKKANATALKKKLEKAGCKAKIEAVKQTVK